jgi:predicted transcriptional regulator
MRVNKTIRIDDGIYRKLEYLSVYTQKHVSDIIEEAIKEYLEKREKNRIEIRL